MARNKDCTENDHDGAVQLEAMRKEDFSWHPCQVSLCPSGVGLIVDYGNDDEQETIVNKADALERLRIRSVPLQGDDCTNINQGDHVLATQKLQSNCLFFDAEIEKALRVRHSKKIHCRCTFVIKWLRKDVRGGNLIVSSSSIMKLATGSINVHPAISTFLNTVNGLSSSSISPFSIFVEDTDCEIDFHEFLEKQIKAIHNSADASKKKITDNILLDVKVHPKGQIQYREVHVDEGNESVIQVPCDQVRLTRSTRSRNQLLTTLQVKELPSTPSMEEDLLEGRSPLNPLAARAALASLMSKLPQNLEFSICNEEENGLIYPSHLTAHKDATIESVTGIKCFNSSVTNKSSEMDKLSSEVDASVTFISKSNKIVRSLFSTRSTSVSSQLVDASSTVLTKGMTYENGTSQVITSSANFTCRTTEGELRQPKAFTLTHSTVHEGSGISNGDNIELKTCVEEVKFLTSTNRRLTLSGIRAPENIQTTESSKWMEENISAKCIKSDSCDQHVMVQENSVLKDKGLDAIALHCTEEQKGLGEKIKRNKKHHVERKTCSEDMKKLAGARRLTRSEVPKETGNKDIMAFQGYERNILAECMKSDFSEKIINIPNLSELEIKKPISSQFDAEINLHPAQEANKERKMSAAAKRSKNAEGNSSSCGSGQGLKRKSTTKKQELRFSPRLRFLPRTRSQKW